MINYRLINCDFLNASTFLKLSNKAKLLYYAFITNSDDLGLVGNCDTIIDILYKYDDGYENAKMLGLEEQLKNDYLNAKIELINKCYVYLFNDKLGNEIFVIKHWFLHQKYREGLRTNYYSIYKSLSMYGGEYYIKDSKEKPIEREEINRKESKEKEKEDKVTENKVTKKMDDKEWDELLEELDTRNDDEEEEEDI